MLALNNRLTPAIADNTRPRPVDCILDTHHPRSGRNSENLRGGHRVRTPPSAQLRTTPMDTKDENLQVMSILKLFVMFSSGLSSVCHFGHDGEIMGRRRAAALSRQ
jgi:hypothetical protein